MRKIMMIMTIKQIMRMMSDHINNNNNKEEKKVNNNLKYTYNKK